MVGRGNNLEKRLADHRAGLEAPRCTGCGCTRESPCVLELPDVVIGECARPAGEGDVCGGCKSPELRATPEKHILGALDAAWGKQ